MPQFISRKRLFATTVTAATAGLAYAAHTNPTMPLGDLKTTAVALASISATITLSPEIYHGLKKFYNECFPVAITATLVGAVYGTIKLAPIVTEHLAEAMKFAAHVKAGIPAQQGAK